MDYLDQLDCNLKFYKVQMYPYLYRELLNLTILTNMSTKIILEGYSYISNIISLHIMEGYSYSENNSIEHYLIFE